MCFSSIEISAQHSDELLTKKVADDPAWSTSQHRCGAIPFASHGFLTLRLTWILVCLYGKTLSFAAALR